jgi:cysteine desulfurase/selenocysteine lyase
VRGVIDLNAVRADTPTCHHQVFLDSAGSSLPPVQVLDEVIGHLRREAEVGGYRAGWERAEDINAGYRVFAELLGCLPHEVAFTDSASRSWLAAFDAVPLGRGDRILATEVEYHSNAIALLHRAREVGASVEPVPSDESGALDVAAFRELVDERVKLVSLVQVPTNGGLVNPVREIVAAAHEAGALVLLDACQSIGQLRVRADETGADIISGTGRKWLRGPRGTGVLIIRDQARDRLRPRLIDGRGAEWTEPAGFRLKDGALPYELWEYSVADRLGLIAAARYALDLGIDAIEAEVRDRAGLVRAGLSELDGVTVHDLGARPCGLVTFVVDRLPAADVRDRLRERNITVTVSDTSSTRWDMTRRGLDELVRASPHYFVTPGQIEEFVAAVGEIARG